MTNSVLEHFDPLFDRVESRKANSKHHSSITKRCTGVAAAKVSFCFRASAGRNPVNGVVLQGSRTRTQCNGTRTRTRTLQDRDDRTDVRS